MRRATESLRVLLSNVVRSTGIEGAFLIAGTALLAIGAGYISPAGPFLTVGAVSLLAGIALAMPKTS